MKSQATTITQTFFFPLDQLIKLVRTLGPGILTATAAIGGSHLVASTQAGAKFGWSLALLILLVNLFKYPFFRAGISYTLATGNTLQNGYARMGKGYIGLAFALNIFNAVVNTSALTLFSASLLGYFLPGQLSLPVLSLVVLAMSLLIVLAGHFAVLNSVSKIIMVLLAVSTVAAAVIAWNNGPVAPAGYVSPSPWTLASIGFLVVTMGWMPAPIDISCLTSLWLAKQQSEQDVTTQSALFDFNLGYVVTAALAVVFLALGVLILHGSGEKLETGGIGFSHQLVNMYAGTIGEWSHNLIALIAFFCIFGSTITVIDGYSRALAESLQLLRNKENYSERSFTYWVVLVAFVCMAILLFFKSALLVMLGFAMTMAFMTTPFFAWLNHHLIQTADMPDELRPGKALVALSYAGLIYLFGFMVLFVWWKWLM
ncbi:NRAMP family divalent metal transporter [Malonomonas rubra]|uniref:NRAMP family divalent metal transporter n=1 Tax=Malonomonas rubra TaxID=57040 RepID=UPI0026EB972E|nr:divalent metal cation transporter [Malonomonas rubra]